MSAIWFDLTNKLEPIHRQALRTIARSAESIGADWFLTGAMARDWIFTHIHGVDTLRATRDADIGIALAGWDEFERIRAHVIASGEFDADRSPHRLNHRQALGFHVDLIPFGRLGGAKAEIAWPPERDVVMNVLGFEEAFRAAVTIRVDIDLPVKVASLPGLMLMKIFAWEDRKHLHPGKDAQDIHLLLTCYEQVAGRSLWDVEGLMAAEEHHADRAAARLLGRDVAVILSPSCRAPLLSILDRELSADTASLLTEQLSCGGATVRISNEGAYRRMQSLLTCFRIGLDD